jgi:hypothetical protein
MTEDDALYRFRLRGVVLLGELPRSASEPSRLYSSSGLRTPPKA